MISYAFIILSGLAVLFGLGFALTSLREWEGRAAAISVAMTFAAGGLLMAPAFLSSPAQRIALIVLAALAVGAALLFMAPIGRITPAIERPAERVDERDMMFSRAFMRVGGREYEQYYAMRPEKKEIDDHLRSLPGLQSPRSRFHDPLWAASTNASFDAASALGRLSEAVPMDDPVALTPERITAFVKRLARYYGAMSVGVTELRPEHVYSHVGRGRGVYGEPITLDHPFAIAVTVEMDHAMIAANPRYPGAAESAKQYAESALVAAQLAQFLRNLCYDARTHTDGNYQVICPLVARDAGLGEIGRMGLLITPEKGPRARIAVVTTTCELIPDSYTPDGSVIDFCTICQKCAASCPSRSIPFGDRQVSNGALRWQIEPESCFEYWATVGTDCGRCMTVCPYSHPDTFYHDLVRWGIRHSGAFRRLAIAGDDLLYGRRPKPKQAPDFTRSG